jgi:hypothetical protein
MWYLHSGDNSFKLGLFKSAKKKFSLKGFSLELLAPYFKSAHKVQILICLALKRKIFFWPFETALA